MLAANVGDVSTSGTMGWDAGLQNSPAQGGVSHPGTGGTSGGRGQWPLSPHSGQTPAQCSSWEGGGMGGGKREGWKGGGRDGRREEGKREGGREEGGMEGEKGGMEGGRREEGWKEGEGRREKRGWERGRISYLGPAENGMKA